MTPLVRYTAKVVTVHQIRVAILTQGNHQGDGSRQARRQNGDLNRQDRHSPLSSDSQLVGAQKSVGLAVKVGTRLKRMMASHPPMCPQC